MRYLLQRLTMSITGSRRRRKRSKAWGSCETAESRVVLSAVAAAAVLDTLPATEIDQQADDVASNDDSQPDLFTATTESSSAGIQHETILLTESSGSPSRDLAVPDTSLGPGSSLNPPADPYAAPLMGDTKEVRFRNGEMPLGFLGDLDQGANFDPTRRPHGPPPPASSDAVESDSTLGSANTTATALVAQTNEELPTDSDLNAESNVDEFWRSRFDGFVEIARPAANHRLPALDSIILGQETELTFADRLRHDRFSSDRDQGEDDIAGNDEATAAAIAFFNRQTAGGFVNSTIDDLYGPSDAQSATARLGRTGLEASVGRLNPFDDGRQAAMLVSVHAQGDSQTSEGNDDATSPNIAMAGLALGMIGIRTQTLSHLWKAMQRMVSRLHAVLMGTKR